MKRRHSTAKLSAALVFVTILLFSSTVFSQDFTLSDDLIVREIADGVLLVMHSYPWAANSLAVTMPDSNVVLIDTPYTPEATAILLDWLAVRAGTARFIAVVTGFHIDNLGGVSELVRRGITVYGLDMTPRLLRERAAETMNAMDGMLAAPGMERYRETYRLMRFEPPTETFPARQGLTLSFGDESLEIYWPGPSHTEDNSVVYFPPRRLLFGGCMVCNASAAQLGFTGDADLAEWPRSLEKVRERYPDAGIVVPGHGAIGGVDLIEHTLTLFSR